MKAVYKLTIEFKVQTQTVYVKAGGVKQAINHIRKMYPDAGQVEFVKQVDPQHSFDIEV